MNSTPEKHLESLDPHTRRQLDDDLLHHRGRKAGSGTKTPCQRNPEPASSPPPRKPEPPSLPDMSGEDREREDERMNAPRIQVRKQSTTDPTYRRSPSLPLPGPNIPRQSASSDETGAHAETPVARLGSARHLGPQPSTAASRCRNDPHPPSHRPCVRPRPPAGVEFALKGRGRPAVAGRADCPHERHVRDQNRLDAIDQRGELTPDWTAATLAVVVCRGASPARSAKGNG